MGGRIEDRMKKMKLLGLAAVLPLMGTAACNSCSGGAASEKGAAASAPSTKPSTPMAFPGATVATFPNLPFPARFASEAKGRPQGIKPTVEEVYAGLKAAGIEVVDTKQHLASPQGARYCVGARVMGDGADPRMEFSVCEYSTPEVAKLGRDWSEASMKTVIPNRTVYVNGQTVLVIREAQKNADNDALVEKAAGVFGKL